MEEEKSIFKQIVEQEELDALKEKDSDAYDEQVEIIELSKSITLPQVKEICKKYLYLPDDNIIDFLLAVYLSNFTEGKRLWTWLIGPPSVGKTELLRALFSEVSLVLDSLTTKTLFSGLRVGGRDPSLFKIINNKVLIIKDFTLSLSLRSEDLKIILAQLRNAYDGFFNSRTGAEDKTYCYETNFTLIAGVTPAIDDHWSVRQQLGERFISWRIPEIDMEKLSAKVKENRGRKMQVRRELKLYFGAFIKKYRDIKEQPVLNDPLATKIGELAEGATWTRTSVMRFGYTREVRRIPEREGSARLFEQLLHLATSLALVRDSKEVTEQDYAILYRVALSSIPPERIQAIELLLELTEEVKKKGLLNSEFWLETPEISDRLNLDTSSTRIILDDLFLLRILHRKGANPLLWRLDPEFAQKWGRIKVF